MYKVKLARYIHSKGEKHVTGEQAGHKMGGNE